MKRLLGKDRVGGRLSKEGLPKSDVQNLVNNQSSTNSEEHYGLFTLHDLSPGEPSAVEYALAHKVIRIAVDFYISVSSLFMDLADIGEILGRTLTPNITGCRISCQNNSKTMELHLEFSPMAMTPVCS